MEKEKGINVYKKMIYKTPLGPIAIIWTKKNNFQIEEIILSNSINNADKITIEKYPNVKSIKSKKEPKKLKNLIKELNKYFNEEDSEFSLEYLNLDKLTSFQKEVLIAEFNTEKGSINTYRELGEMINKPKAYRAVGNALSKNPFPIIIPCHRTVKADRTIGGFGGVKEGLEAKRILLSIEGIMIEDKKVLSDSPIISMKKEEQRKITSY